MQIVIPSGVPPTLQQINRAFDLRRFDKSTKVNNDVRGALYVRFTYTLKGSLTRKVCEINVVEGGARADEVDLGENSNH